jgi:hypothetical protein
MSEKETAKSEAPLMEPRGISGVYFRFQDPTSGKWGNRVFEDLPESEQDRILSSYTPEQVKRMAKIMATTLRKIGDQFDIATRDSEE